MAKTTQLMFRLDQETAARYKAALKLQGSSIQDDLERHVRSLLALLNHLDPEPIAGVPLEDQEKTHRMFLAIMRSQGIEVLDA